MTVQEMQKEILRLKEEQGMCILAHTYQSHDVTEIADFTGDSFQLSMKARSAPRSLRPHVRRPFYGGDGEDSFARKRRCICPSPRNAGCPMAEQLTPEDRCCEEKKEVSRLHDGGIRQYHGGAQSGERRVRHLLVRRGDRSASCPRKGHSLYSRRQSGRIRTGSTAPKSGCISCTEGCPVHACMTATRTPRTQRPRTRAPNFSRTPRMQGGSARLCRLRRLDRGNHGVCAHGPQADRNLSSERKLSVAEHLGFEYPDKTFYPLSKKLICPDMKATTLPDVYRLC